MFLHFPMRFLSEKNILFSRCAYFCEHLWDPLEELRKSKIFDFQSALTCMEEEEEERNNNAKFSGHYVYLRTETVRAHALRSHQFVFS